MYRLHLRKITKKTLGVPIRISSQLRNSVVNNKDSNFKSVGVVPCKPTAFKGPNSTKYIKTPEKKLMMLVKFYQSAECSRDDCGEGENSHSATENDESTTSRRTLGYTRPLANKCFSKTTSPTRTSEVTKQPDVRDEGASCHSATDTETTPARRTLGYTTIPLANEFSSSCKTTFEVSTQSACSDSNPSPGLPEKSIDCEPSIRENKARKKLIFNYSAKNDEGNHRQHLKRKAVQQLKPDVSDNDSEESDSRRDFDGSDFDDPTWGDDKRSTKESSSSDSEDETGSSPESSLPNSARSVNSSSSARPSSSTLLLAMATSHLPALKITHQLPLLLRKNLPNQPK
ncbi:dentin sialophosphoprotein-like [Frankliniella occidentalis]|uniref:Dentin sialophosphoprotein-like n=1 Tax=Frankliniella occidentalis TaxID=133901 RepID=A0A9C6X2E7_FRAOC|nr:dentin sialophosphoprotein-like [Frankliniella occidentalis]